MGKQQERAPGRIEAAAAHIPLVVAHTGFVVGVFLETAEVVEQVAGMEREMCQAQAHTEIAFARTEFHPLAAGIGRAPGAGQAGSWGFPNGPIWR